MKKKQYAYKLVNTNEDENLCSIWVQGKLYTIYPIGKWVEAKIGGFLCYETVEQAKNSGICGCFLLYKCEVQNPVPLPKQRLEGLFGLYLLTIARACWGNKRIPEAHVTSVWPKGTVAYQRVKLLERINR